MSFLLDTCLLSELTRPKPHPNVVRWFEAQDSATLFVSVLTIGEIEKGVTALPTRRKKVTLSGWLATLRSTYGEQWSPRNLGDFQKTGVALLNAWQT